MKKKIFACLCDNGAIVPVRPSAEEQKEAPLVLTYGRRTFQFLSNSETESIFWVIYGEIK
jgi:hypothetical protein